ncbi:MAG: ABC transporter permease [Acidimicrobiales bacterium]|nr:ABC transporter permease [Acidimicrobiales bacterium]
MILVVQQVLFPAPAGNIVQGVILGLITAMVAVGMWLIFRANRVINFATAEFGFLPGIIAMLLIVESGWAWWAGFGVGVIIAGLLGVITEFVIIRRFFDSPRLVLTVATIGVAQLFGLIAIFVPAWWDTTLQNQRIEPPFGSVLDIGNFRFDANDLMVVIIAPTILIAVGLLLRYTRLGVAIRASAELPSRAMLLGIPVKGLQSVVWAIFGVLTFTALFLRIGVFGTPVAGQLGLLFFLRGLAALTLGRFTHLPTIIASALAIGVLQQGVAWNTDGEEAQQVIGAVIGVIVVLSLVLRRDRGLRSAIDGASWQSVGESRPVAAVFRRLLLVRVGRIAGFAVIAFSLLWWLPYSGQFGTTVQHRFAIIFIFTILFISLGVLTGWAGMLSLGQLGFFAIGGVVAGKLTVEYDLDYLLALLAAGAAGAAASLVVGVPALRLRGNYLAVATLVFSIAVAGYFLNPQFFDWVLRPTDRIERNPILGVVDWRTTRASYFVALAVTAVMILAANAIRRSRTGRILIALRDNEDGTEAFGISAVRAKLTAFAISGFFAAVAGGVAVHHDQFFQPDNPLFNLSIFTGAVLGGLGTAAGAALGALYFNGTFFWLREEWRLFTSAIGTLLILWLAPSGLHGLWQTVRDMFLRWYGARRGVVDADLSEDLLDVSAPESLEEVAS